MGIARFDNERSAREVIDLIQAQAAQRHGARAGRVYHDEPILRTGADLATRVGAGAPADRATQMGAGAPADRATRSGAPANHAPAAAAPRDGHDAGDGVRPLGTITLSGTGTGDADERIRFVRVTASGSRDARGHVGGWRDRWQAPERPPLPARYAAVREIARRPDMWHAGAARLFYEQAKIMEAYEDDVPAQGSFSRYFPTYQSMDDRQLRWYVTWRTQVRAHPAETGPQDTPVSFLFVYIYETICGIGVDDPRDGLALLRGLPDRFPRLAEEVRPYLVSWARDYAAYHGLEICPASDGTTAGAAGGVVRAILTLQASQDETLARIGRGVASDAAADEGAVIRATLAGTFCPQACLPAARAAHVASPAATTGVALPATPDVALPATAGEARREPGTGGGDDELFRAVLACCPKTVSNSRFFRDRPDDARAVIATVFRRLVEHCARHRKTTLMEGLFGGADIRPYVMFSSALFYDPVPHPDAVVPLSTTSYLVCHGGAWTQARRYRHPGTSARLGTIVHYVDAAMRQRDGYAHPLKAAAAPKYLERIVSDAIDQREAQVAAHALSEVVIDFSRLSGIRSRAAETREALLVDEERGDLEDELRDEEGTLWSAMADDGVERVAGAAVGAESLEPAETAQGSEAAGGAEVTRPVAAGSGGAAHRDADDAAAGQRAVVELLLAGKPLPARIGQTMTSLVIDAINERAYDVIGDAAIEFVDDVPQVVEDYVDDLRELVGLA